MSPISFDLGSAGMAGATSELLTGPHSLTEQLLAAATSSSGSNKTPAKRQNLRSRSNSMPVSFSSTSGECAFYLMAYTISQFNANIVITSCLFSDVHVQHRH